MARVATIACGIGLLVASGCEWDGVKERRGPNLPPSVQITGGAVDGGEAAYDVEFFWFGSDPDGTIDHFEYAIDDTCLCTAPDSVTASHPGTGEPVTIRTSRALFTAEACRALGVEPRYATADSIWRRTERFSGRFHFTATTPILDSSPPMASDPHTFFIRAVDDRAARSEVAVRTFDATTIAPTSRLLGPLGDGEERSSTVSSFFTVRWTGRDEDSLSPDRRPVGYQLKMVDIGTIFNPDPFVYACLVSDFVGCGNLLIPTDAVVPDSVALTDSTYHETDWWPKQTDPYRPVARSFEGVPVGDYAIAVRAIDVAGAVTPATPGQALFIADAVNGGNIAKLSVNPGIPAVPHIDVRELNLLGSREFRASGERPWEVEVPVSAPLRFRWDVDASWYGARFGGVNFAIDIPDPGCEVCQAGDGVGGWFGWGNYEGVPYDLTFDQSQAGTTHILHVRARDESFLPERETFATILLDVVAFPFDKTALLVDDFRFSGIDDCAHDAIIERMVSRGVADHLKPGETLDIFDARRPIETPPGSGQFCEELNAPERMFLSRLGRYKVIYWNVSDTGLGTTLGSVTDPSPSAPFGRYLSIYVGAGGNLIVWGSLVTGALLGDRLGPWTPDTPLFPTPSYGVGSFVWDVLGFRTEIGKVSGLPGAFSLSCSGIVGFQATEAALAGGLPAGRVDPSGYSTDPGNATVTPRTAFWVTGWSGRENPSGWRGPTAMTGRPPQISFGLDTLYTYVSNGWAWEETSDGLFDVCQSTTGSPFEGNPVIVRKDDPASIQGRVVWIGTPLFPFDDGQADQLDALMEGLTDWVLDAP